MEVRIVADIVKGCRCLGQFGQRGIAGIEPPHLNAVERVQLSWSVHATTSASLASSGRMMAVWFAISVGNGGSGEKKLIFISLAMETAAQDCIALTASLRR
ncbi:MAG: hypothetical protein WDN49_18750 [Acetobacteraceae bacterium]